MSKVVFKTFLTPIDLHFLFTKVSDNKPVAITKIPEDDQNLYYKDEPYTTKKLHQRLIVTYSPKYALYQKKIRDK